MTTDSLKGKAAKHEGDELPEAVLEMHPIALLLAAELAHPGSDGEEFGLSDAMFDEVSSTVVSYVGDDEQLPQIALALAAVAAALDARSPQLAEKLRDILRKPEVKNAVLKRGEFADPEKVAEAARQFDEFAGREPERKAPMDLDERPKGTLTIDKLKFPKRL